MPKIFGIPREDIKQLATGNGGCFATDEILVHGKCVRFMYREAPDANWDSGWRFLAGNESQDYLDDPSNSDIYDVNTIANYDPRIIPYLQAPPGTAFEWVEASDCFIQIES